MDTLTGSFIQCVKMVVVQNHLVAPRPTIVRIAVVDIREAVEHLLDIVDHTILDILNQSLFLALRQQQATQVHPLALTDSANGPADIPFLLSTLQHSTHIDTQGDIVILQTLLQRRGIDHILMEIIGRYVITGGMTQVFQDLDTLHNLTHSERRKPVEVDDTLTRLP